MVRLVNTGMPEAWEKLPSDQGFQCSTILASGIEMVGWIESQSIPLITLVIFACCYALAAITIAAVTLLSRRPVGEDLKMLSPVTLTPLAVILGLLIAFLATRVWDNVGRARDYIGQEAGALSRVLLFADTLPLEVRAKVQSAVKDHVEFVVQHDWPEMAVMNADPREEPVGLRKMVTALLSFTPAQADQQLAQKSALAAIEQAFQARRNRIRLSRTEISLIQWNVIFVLFTLILFTTAMVHIGRPAAMAAALIIFSSAIASCLTLLMVNDRPFAAGGVTIAPAEFRQIIGLD
jgi:hypothetical protein